MNINDCLLTDFFLSNAFPKCFCLPGRWARSTLALIILQGLNEN